MTGIIALETALGDHHLDRATNRQLLADLFSPSSRVFDLLDAQGVEERFVMCEPSWYLRMRPFAERMAVSADRAARLAARSAKEALCASGCSPTDIGAVVMVTSTTLSMPGLECGIISELGLPESVLRVPMWGRGCAGGAAGLRLAATLCEGLGGRAVLLVVVDCCTANVQRDDRSLLSMMVTSMYGDGAAAAVIAPTDGRGAIIATRSDLVDGTTEVGGWDIVDSGLRYRHQAAIAQISAVEVPRAIAALRRDAGVAEGPMERAALHPTNRQVLHVQSDHLGLSDTARRLAIDNLRLRGNLSGPSVLFGLRDVFDGPTTGEPVLVLATGPGYSIEQVLVRW